LALFASLSIITNYHLPLSGALVAKESIVPIWAYCYCGLILAGTIFNLYDKDKIKNAYQFSGETLAGICAVLVFLIAYNVVDISFPQFISTLLVIYTTFWTYHAQRHYLNYEKFKKVIHNSAIEVHEKMVKELSEILESATAEGVDPSEFDDIKEDYDFEQTEKEAHYLYIGVLVVISVLAIPYLYVYLKSLGVFGN
jgi:hypothetical protein